MGRTTLWERAPALHARTYFGAGGAERVSSAGGSFVEGELGGVWVPPCYVRCSWGAENRQHLREGTGGATEFVQGTECMK